MIVRNAQNLPETLVKAVSIEKHNKDGRYSATTLLKGACEVMLTKRHWDDIEVDASDSIWAIFGTAVHAVFEEQKDDTFKEEFFTVNVSNSKVTGRIDCYDLEKEMIVDWKTTSCWKVIYKDFSDWYKQGMIYAWLLKKSGLSVKHCKFVALLKDHSKSKAMRDREYPQSPVYTYEFDVTDEALEETEKFIVAKVKEFEESENVKDEDLLPCSFEERWATKSKWAVMKKGRKSALKLCDSESEAEDYKSAKGGDYIEYRKGENKKCDSYCNCREWCPFWRENGGI